MTMKPVQTLTANDPINQNRSSQIFQILIVVGWVIFQFWVGNQVYAAFLFVFFIAFALRKRPSFTLLAIPVLVITLFSTQTINSLVQLKRWNLNSVQNYKSALITIFTPNSGQEVLPGTVQQMLSLLHEHELGDYRLSEQLDADLMIHQRIIESAWPIRPDAASANMLGYIEEIQKDSTCTILDQTMEIALAHCN